LLEKPQGKKWRNAELWHLKLWDKRWPVCGYRLCWVVKGYKRVALSTGIMHTKINMRIQDWDNIAVKERYHTEEDKRLFKDKRERIWNEAEQSRLLVASGKAKKKRGRPKVRYPKR
jgi:hypothetical protein|tara:strand:- start:12686 stop:13033 length:348 start_codon:yes stop_codon:yes gene_type:complete